MPADRLFHPRLGHSKKVSSLSHLGARVWTQYILSSDDFGVMVFSALRVQADNMALAKEPQDVVNLALSQIVSAGLVGAFEHQGVQYLFQRDWQDFQKVEYPRVTFLPKPPADLLKTCTPKTRGLFGNHPGGVGKRSPKVSQTSSEGFPTTRARVRAKRLTANGKRQTAGGESEGNQPRTAVQNGVDAGFAAFWSAYPRKTAKVAAQQAWSKLTPSADVLQRILDALTWQASSAAWTKDGGQFVPYPATWLNAKRWEDERPAPIGAAAGGAFGSRVPSAQQTSMELEAERRRIDQIASSASAGVAR